MFNTADNAIVSTEEAASVMTLKLKRKAHMGQIEGWIANTIRLTAIVGANYTMPSSTVRVLASATKNSLHIILPHRLAPGTVQNQTAVNTEFEERLYLCETHRLSTSKKRT